MAREDKKVYFEYWPPHGTKPHYIAVDPQRWNNRNFPRFCHLDNVSMTYMTAHGVEAVLNRPLDITPVIAAYDRIAEQARANIALATKDGDAFAEKLLNSIAPMKRMIEALGVGDTDKGVSCVEQALYGVMSVGCELAASLAVAAQTQIERDGAYTILEEHPELVRVNNELYTRWATASETLCQCVIDLKSIKQELMTQRETFQQHVDTCRISLTEKAQDLREAYVFFEEGDDCFNVTAYGYRGDHHGRRNMTVLIEAARQHIVRCRLREKTVQEAKQFMEQIIREKTLPLRDKIATTLASFDDALKAFHDYASRLERKPYEMLLGAYTEEEFRTAEGIVDDPEWRIAHVGRVFDALFSHILLLSNTSIELPDSIARALTDAERHIARIEMQWKEATTESKPPSRPAPPSPAMELKEKPTTSTQEAMLIDEVYEMILCIGCVRTGQDAQHLRKASWRSLWRTLQHLERYDASMLENIREAVHAKLFVVGEREVVAIEQVREQWARSSVRWFSFKQGHNWLLKMTKSGAESALPLLAKYHLTREQIGAAYERGFDEAQKRYNNKH